jgi:hypothetical protein
MFSRVSWSLLIAAGLVGSGAGMALTQSSVRDESVAKATPTAPANVLPELNAMLRPVNDEVRTGYAQAQAAAQNPFAVFRATNRRL